MVSTMGFFYLIIPRLKSPTIEIVGWGVQNVPIKIGVGKRMLFCSFVYSFTYTIPLKNGSR
jgi:hypothetical protein